MKLQDLGYSREQAELMLEALNGVELRRKNQKQKKQIHGRNQIIRELTKAVELGIAMIDPENSPPQWSTQDALKMLREAREKAVRS